MLRAYLSLAATCGGGIAWIGSSFYFIPARPQPLHTDTANKKHQRGVPGEDWQVHGGRASTG